MYNHGGDVYSQNIKLDFSININPLGMPESVKQEIINHISDYEKYPDYDCRLLREKIANKYSILKDDIICSNGASELIYNVVRCLKPGRGVVLEPAFSEYQKALFENGCEVVHLPVRNKTGLLDDAVIVKCLCEELLKGCDILFMCNPINPSGLIFKQGLIIEILDKCAQYNTFVVLDECFLEFTGEKTMAGYLRRYPNVFILNAFTKIYAMAGIRLGFGMCGDRQFMERLRDIGPYWNVSAVAQAAGVRALDEIEYVENTVIYVKNELEYLKNELVKIGFNVSESSTNYILLQWQKTKDIDWYSELLKEGVLIRKCSDYYGLDDSFYRIAVKRHEDNETLINIMRKISNG